MAHARKDTLVGCGERRKHLKPFEKNKQARRERRAARDFIRELKEQACRDQDFELGAILRDSERALTARLDESK